MKIFKSNTLPKPRYGNYADRPNWGIEMDNGKRYYGFHSYEQAEQALVLQPYHPVYKNIYQLNQ